MAAASPAPSPAELSREIEQFLATHPRAVLLEDGRVLFDLLSSQYSLADDHGRCVLQFWSEERTLVRTITGLERRKDGLRLEVRRFGQTRPQRLHLLSHREQATPAARAVSRTQYLRTLERVLPRAFPDYKLESLSSAADLEHSFGPAYARGLLTRGQSAWALIAAGSGETQSTLDGILTLGILWLDLCRESAGKRVIEGLRILLPAGTAELTRSRLGRLDHSMAKWELYEMNASGEELTPAEADRDGNLRMKLLHAFDESAALARMAEPVERILALLPRNATAQVETRAKSPTEVAVSLYGLEFARVRHGIAPGSFLREDRITFGAGANETPLTSETEDMLRDLVARLFAARHPAGDPRDPLFRLQAERWLEATLRHDLLEIEPGLRSEFVYRQVPAFAAGDRGMLDLLTVTASGRLAVLELKADEDLHLPLQGLDYWIRVHRLHQQRNSSSELTGDFERGGYFPGIALSPQAPLLYFVAPALRVHPANETVLHYLSPEVQWTMLALNEGWRSERIVVWRKHGGKPSGSSSWG
jgi:hypothetical protein